jgi:hypothetical protein
MLVQFVRAVRDKSMNELSDADDALAVHAEAHQRREQRMRRRFRLSRAASPPTPPQRCPAKIFTHVRK